MIRAFLPKPPCGACLSRAHPLATGLAGFWVFNECGGRLGMDAVRPQTRAEFADFGMLRAQGAFFHGSTFPATSWATVPNHPGLRPSDWVSFAMRTKTSQTTFQSGVLAQALRGSDLSSGNSYGYAITPTVTTFGTSAIAVNAGGVDRVVIATVPPPNTEWHDHMGTWDGSTLRYYIDGTLVGTASGSGLLQYNTGSNMIFGAMTASGTNYYEGHVEFAAVWFRPLQASEVREFVRDPYAMMRAPRIAVGARLANAYFYQRHVLGHGGGAS